MPVKPNQTELNQKNNPKLKSNIKALQKNNNYTTKKQTSRTVELRGTGMFCAALNNNNKKKKVKTAYLC